MDILGFPFPTMFYELVAVTTSSLPNSKQCWRQHCITLDTRYNKCWSTKPSKLHSFVIITVVQTISNTIISIQCFLLLLFF